MRVLVIASGGGHTSYALALVENLPKTVEVDAVVPKGGITTRWLLEPYVNKFYETAKRPPASLFEALTDPFKLKFEDYDGVFASGSNHSLFTALRFIRDVPVVTIEAADRVVTKSTSVNILSMLGADVALHWPAQRALYPRGYLVGPACRKVPKHRGDDYILVHFGSVPFPEAVRRLRRVLANEDVVLVGKDYTNSINPYHVDLPDGWDWYEWVEDFPELIADAKLVITHQSVTALESAVAGTPVLMVFHPHIKSSTWEDTRLYAMLIGGTAVEWPELSRPVIESAMENKPKVENRAKDLAELFMDIVLPR